LPPDKTHLDFLGLQFKHQGRDWNGVDCWGLVILYYKEVLGIELPDWDYEPDWSKRGGNFFIEKNNGIGVRVKRPKKNDVVLFYIDKNTKVPNHAGIVTDTFAKFMIQAGKSGVCSACYEAPIWKNRLEGFYRICPN